MKNQVLDPKGALVRPTRGWVCSAKFRAMNLPIGSPTPPRFADLLRADGDPLANIKLSEEPAKNLVVIMGGHYPSSKVVTPNTRSNRNGGIAPVYMRAVSNTGTSPRSCAQATASRVMLGTSRKISPPPPPASKSDRTTSAGGRALGPPGPSFLAFPPGSVT